MCEEVCEWLLQTSVEFCRRRFNVALIMTNQPTQGFPYRSCYKENISYNITHILYIDRWIHSALYWLTAFYQPQNLSGCSEWIILDHPVFLICECAGSCSPRHFRTPPMVPSTLPRTALNSAHFIQNTDPFFQIHWYSAILDSGWFCKCLKTYEFTTDETECNFWFYCAQFQKANLHTLVITTSEMQLPNRYSLRG